MSHCFRIRFVLGNHVRLETDKQELVFADQVEHGESVVLKPSDQASSIRDAKHLVLRGESYPTEREAESAASRWRSLLQTSFSRLNIGADFGDRAPQGAFTEHGLKALADHFGGRVLNDVHGVLLFECAPAPVFVRQEAAGTVGKSGDRLVAAVQAASQLGITMTDQEQLAYDLYSASFFQPAADARFTMLAMALETLISPAPRADAVVAHVDQLIKITQTSSLPSNEIESIVGTLRWLHEESIGQAGRRLATTLGDRTYMNENPAKFFTRCYELRSQLVHGHKSRPSTAAVGLRAAHLETFLSHLLSGPLLAHIAD